MKTTAPFRTWCANLCGGRDLSEACRCGVFAGTSVNPAAANISSLFCTGLQAEAATHMANRIRADRTRAIVLSYQSDQELYRIPRTRSLPQTFGTCLFVNKVDRV